VSVLVAAALEVVDASVVIGVVVELFSVGGVTVASVVRGVDEDVASTCVEARRISKTLAKPAIKRTRALIPPIPMVFGLIND
jgi:hypothetical protein